MLVTENAWLEKPIPPTPAGWRRRMLDSTFYIRLTQWEYWSMYVSNLPMMLIWLWFATRARRLFFFTVVNPVIETGGAWGESKFGILRRIPSSHLPKTLFVKQGTALPEVLEKMQDAGLKYPVIAKPNIGERGFLVSKIKDEAGLQAYFLKNKTDFLIQTFITWPLELAVMYHRLPGSRQGQVTSICIKETLKATGDGRSSVRQMMEKNPRARMQVARFETEFPEKLAEILPAGHTAELEPIGNHCRGTLFLNGNSHIDEALTARFDEVGRQMDGIHYGRFDLKCHSIEDLRATGRFLVMEFNGIGAEPAHIYDPAYPVWKKYRDIYRHWRVIFQIYRLQAAKGLKSLPATEGIADLRNYVRAKRVLIP